MVTVHAPSSLERASQIALVLAHHELELNLGITRHESLQGGHELPGRSVDRREANRSSEHGVSPGNASLRSFIRRQSSYARRLRNWDLPS